MESGWHPLGVGSFIVSLRAIELNALNRWLLSLTSPIELVKLPSLNRFLLLFLGWYGQCIVKQMLSPN